MAYLAADIDRCFGRDNLPDHADLLSNLVRWTAADQIPLQVTGPGLIDCHLYEQEGRQVHELIPVDPITIRVKRPEGVAGTEARLLVAGSPVTPVSDDDWTTLEIPPIIDHEVAVIA